MNATAHTLFEEAPAGFGGRRHGRSHGHRRRMFDAGEFRALLLALIAEEPAHGYELIKSIEDRFSGGYSPSPGVIYPTLSWLVDMGYAAVEDEAAGRKRYAATPEGKVWLAANESSVAAVLSRRERRGGPPSHAPIQVVRAMENLKTALRLRLEAGEADEATIDAIAAAIDAAAGKVEKA